MINTTLLQLRMTFVCRFILDIIITVRIFIRVTQENLKMFTQILRSKNSNDSGCKQTLMEEIPGDGKRAGDGP